MKKVLIGLFLSLLLLFFVIFSKLINRNTITYKLNNKTYQLMVADSPEEHAKGLMYFRELKNADGMIFLFPNKLSRNFWNKNTLIDLDVYWLDDDRVVGKSFLPSIEKSKDITTVSSPQPINKVIELVR